MNITDMTEKDWKNYSKGLLKSELAKRNISHEELIKKLKKIGVEETQGGVANKLSRGTFSAIFLLQCLRAIKCENLRLENWNI